MKRARSFSYESVKRQCLQRPPVACKRACPSGESRAYKRAKHEGPSLVEAEVYRLRNENAACKRVRESCQQQNRAMRSYIEKAVERIRELECENATLRSAREPYAVLRDLRTMARG